MASSPGKAKSDLFWDSQLCRVHSMRHDLDVRGVLDLILKGPITRLPFDLPLTMEWTTLPMIKQITFAAALLCLASPSFARHPFANDPLITGPSVLVRADVPLVADLPGSEAALPATDPQAAPSAPLVDGAVPSDAPADGDSISAAPMVAAQSAPVYRMVRPSRQSNNGLLGGLIELERKKNAWIRRNFFGR